MGLGEFQLIERFLSAFPPARVRVGPGDDCAVLASVGGDWCVTTDAVMEDVHFTRRHFSLEDIGHKALAVNLSDLAAMGARPDWFLCAVGWPSDLSARELTRLARSMAALAQRTRISLVGGNFTAADKLSLTLTVAGRVPSGRALRRSGARVGDLLFVSGTLGDARQGYLTMAQGAGKNPWARRQRRPTPRLPLGQLARRWATAGIDLSDGFAQDLGQLCAASGVGAVVEVEKLPVGRALVQALGRARALEMALQGGEDYELLLSVPLQRAARFQRLAREAGHRVTEVGVVAPGRVRLMHKGVEVGAPPGFDHFASE